LTNGRAPFIQDLISKYMVINETSRLQYEEQSEFVSGFWVKRGVLEPKPQPHYILTDTSGQNLADPARIVSLSDHPVLVQGNTSVVTYLAHITGNMVVRSNIHEHTDIQEYFGFYTSDRSGRPLFKLGMLAEAMQARSWVILDEFNLASTRDLVINNGVIQPLLALVNPETPAPFLRNVTGTISNFSRNKNPFPPFEVVKQCLSCLAQPVQHTDKEVLADACWALSYLTDGTIDFTRSRC
jgi:hypothetical protein